MNKILISIFVFVSLFGITKKSEAFLVFLPHSDSCCSGTQPIQTPQAPVIPQVNTSNNVTPESDKKVEDTSKIQTPTAEQRIAELEARVSKLETQKVVSIQKAPTVKKIYPIIQPVITNTPPVQQKIVWWKRFVNWF